MAIQLFSGNIDEELDSADIGLRLCSMLGDVFNVLSCNQEEALLPKLENFAIDVKKLISKNPNSNRFVRKIIRGLNLIHNKLIDASASNDPSASASAFKKAEKELFLKNLFKKGLNSVTFPKPKSEPKPELEPEPLFKKGLNSAGVHPEPKPIFPEVFDVEFDREPEPEGVHPEPEPIFPEVFDVEFDRDRLLSEIFEVMNDLTAILAEIKDLSAVTKKSKVPFVLRLKKKKVLDSLKTLDFQICSLKLMKNCFRKNYDLDIEMSELWGPNPYAK